MGRTGGGQPGAGDLVLVASIREHVALGFQALAPQATATALPTVWAESDEYEALPLMPGGSDSAQVGEAWDAFRAGDSGRLNAGVPGLRPVGPAPLAPHAGDGDVWSDLVCSYGWDCAQAWAIIECESGGEPWKVNPSGSYGLMQIQAYWHMDKLRRVTGSDDVELLLDPVVNLEVGWLVYQESGGGSWEPWSCRPW